ncbi:hypothetical protein DLREEDagrD3_28600 [Denitratisoma sp. agr-D3]
MSNPRLELLEEQLDEQQDEVMALRFAFMTLSRALHDQGVLPLGVTAGHLGRAADSVRQESLPGPGDLSPVAAKIDELRGVLIQWQ